MSLGRPRRVGIYKPYNALVNVLRIAWVVVVFYNELGTFNSHVSHCAWPDAALAHPSSTHRNDATAIHVLVLADPQIIDSRSYPGRNPWLMWISQLMVDLNLRKNWRAALRLRPDVVVFLGDMMDSGRIAMSDEEYEQYYRRFRNIFRPTSTKPLLTYYLPGNHDIGLGDSPRFSDRAVERYSSHFGPPNQVIDVGGHTFVLIDAPGLVDEEDRRARSGLSYAQWAAASPEGVISFIQSLELHPEQKPVVLFTHIPLARPDGAPCGSLRERGTIRKGWGFGYQNTLAPHTSQFLLQSTHPDMVFSGDDHDYCEYVHTYSSSSDREAGSSTARPRSVKEVTVKSFSMAMGVRQPGFQLLSLSPPLLSRESVATSPCLLPDQLGIYVSSYAPMFLITLTILLLSNIHRVRTRERWAAWFPLPGWCQGSLWSPYRVNLCGRRLTVKIPWIIQDSGRAEGLISASSNARASRMVGYLQVR